MWYRELFVLCLPSLALGSIFDLSGLQWTLKSQNGTISIPATVPSQAHLDLLKAGIITEPLLGVNGECGSHKNSVHLLMVWLDYSERWVNDENWTYTADLSPWTSVAKNGSEKTLLVFYGIDTVANIVRNAPAPSVRALSHCCL